MEPVRFADGFDGPDRIAFGLGAGALGVVAGGLALAYLVLHSPLPGPLAGAAALLIVGAAALLGWGRWAGRAALDWGLAAGRFAAGPASLEVGLWPLGGETVRSAGLPGGLDEEPQTSHPGAAPGGFTPELAGPSLPPPSGSRAWERWLAAGPAAGPAQADAPAPAEEGPRPTPVGPPPLDDEMVDWVHRRVRGPDRDGEIGSGPRAAVPLVVLAGPGGEAGRCRGAGTEDGAGELRLTAAPNQTGGPSGPRRRAGRARRITFFALSGGVGRTTLALEVSALLAARGVSGDPRAEGPLRVAYVDLDHTGSTAALRLGTRPPLEPPDAGGAASPLVLPRQRTGLLPVVMDTRAEALREPLTPAAAAALVHRLEADGAELVIIDCNGGPAALATWVLETADEIYVVLGDSARGVQDAYRATATLRGLGHGGKLAYVVNQSTGRVDLGPTLDDLRGSLAAVIPRDEAIADAEASHQLVGLEGEGPGARALRGLAAAIHPLTGPLAGEEPAQPGGEPLSRTSAAGRRSARMLPAVGAG